MALPNYNSWPREKLIAHLEVHGLTPVDYGGNNLLVQDDNWDKFEFGQLVELAMNAEYWVSVAQGTCHVTPYP